MSEVRRMMEARSTGINQVLEQKNAGFFVTAEQAFKNNGVLDGFSLRSDGRSTTPMVYMTEELMEKTDTELAEYFEHVFRTCKPDFQDLSNVITKDFIMNNARPRLYSSDNIPDMEAHGIAYMRMKGVPLVIGFYLIVGKQDNGIATVTLRCNHLEATGIDITDLYDVAILNEEKECVVASMTDILGNLMGNFNPVEPEFPVMWVVTNRLKMNGAAAILCQSVVEQLKNRIGDRFGIIPCSVNELICLSADGMDENYLTETVSDINRTMVSTEERLTDQVMIFEDGVIRTL